MPKCEYRLTNKSFTVLGGRQWRATCSVVVQLSLSPIPNARKPTLGVGQKGSSYEKYVLLSRYFSAGLAPQGNLHLVISCNNTQTPKAGSIFRISTTKNNITAYLPQINFIHHRRYRWEEPRT